MDTCRPAQSTSLGLSICVFLCTLCICEPHLYMARPASTSIQSRAKSICRTKDDILFTTVCATPRTMSGRSLMILPYNLKSLLFPRGLLWPPHLTSNPTRPQSHSVRPGSLYPTHHRGTLAVTFEGRTLRAEAGWCRGSLLLSAAQEQWIWGMGEDHPRTVHSIKVF